MGKLRKLAAGTGLLAAMLLFVLLAPAAEASHKKKDRSLRHVMFVGNNWDGTVDAVHPRGRYLKITRINVIPDKEERMAEIFTDPVRLGFFLGIRAAVGEG
ncbi:MAG: YncE family protein, partial [Solirubrobacterales bacterium]